VQSELTYAISPAGPGDAVDLARVHVEAWRETYPGLLPQVYLDRMSVASHARRWRFRLMNGAEVTLAAETPEGLVGYCSGDWTRGGARPGEAEIATLYVLRRAQRAGLGRRLLTGTARALAARGASSLVIWVLRDNAGARRFYEALGGVCERERDEPIAGGLVTSVAYRWSDIEALTA
jgi:ribosomal protein S18 acetylase RimI-like enzyme